MSLWICTACGAEHPDTPRPPAGCPICLDDRQYVPASGQGWITATQLEADHTFAITELEPDLFGITVQPAVAIGQRTLLLRTPEGNVLWEPSAFISAELVLAVLALGRVRAIAMSHPHLAGACVSWSHMLSAGHDRVPVYWNRHDERWIQRPDPAFELWSGTTHPVPGVTLVQTGGHFPGSSVLHWPAGAGGQGVLLSGDTVMTGPGGRTVSFMRSYPNLLPLPERLVRQIAGTLENLQFDRIYGLHPQSLIPVDAQRIVAHSAERYIGWLTDELRDPDE